MAETDLISRQAAIDYCYQLINVEYQQGSDEMNYVQERVSQTETILHHLEFMPSAQPEQMTNRQWIDFLSAQFDISRTSAKEMLHGMMQCKKEDNFKKLFNGGRAE